MLLENMVWSISFLFSEETQKKKGGTGTNTPGSYFLTAFQTVEHDSSENPSA